MPRRDNIDDMLVPDKDEIQAYRGQTSTVVEGPVQKERMGHPVAMTRMQAASMARQPKHSSDMLVMLVLLLAVLAGSGYWMYSRMEAMASLLAVSNNELDHVRKHIGELEALVVATDVSANKSGTVVQTQVKMLDNRAKERIKFVDAELEKLWGIAYGTNKPAIEEAKKALDNQNVGIKQHTQQLATQEVLLKEQQAIMATQQKQMDDLVAVNNHLTNSIAQQNNILNQQATDINSQAALVLQQNAVIDDAVVMAESVGNMRSDLQENQGSIAKLEQLITVVRTGLADLSAQFISDSGSTSILELQTVLATLERKMRVAIALEKLASELDERLYMAESALDSNETFRQETNRRIDQLTNQIRTLQYGE